jgi:hypothetical protein
MIAIVSIVIAVVPVVLGVPTMLVFIPPTMIVVPAIVARFAQLVTRMVRLLALAPMMLDGLMKMMIRFGDSLLAIVIGAHTRCASEEQESRKRRTGQRYFPRAENSRLKFCLHPVLLYV